MYYRLEQTLIEAQQIHAPEGQTPEDAGWLQFDSREAAEAYFGIGGDPLQRYLDAREVERDATFRAVRTQTMKALLANGFTEGQALEAGTLFVRYFAPQIAAYRWGDKPGLPAAIQESQQFAWLDLDAQIAEGTVRDLLVSGLS